MPTEHYTLSVDPRFIDLTGEKFGRLTVIEFRGRKHGHSAWLCNCSCGKSSVVIGKYLRRGNTKSCGCYNRDAAKQRHTTHGESWIRLNRIYWKMLERCRNQNCPSYKNYGGRGITICEGWMRGYEVFRDWSLAHGCSDELTIERIDVNGPYSPENCCWIPGSLQARNLRKTRYVTAFGETKGVCDWAEDPRCSVNSVTLRSRLSYGWDAERAVSTPRFHGYRGGGTKRIRVS